MAQAPNNKEQVSVFLFSAFILIFLLLFLLPGARWHFIDFPPATANSTQACESCSLVHVASRRGYLFSFFNTSLSPPPNTLLRHNRGSSTVPLVLHNYQGELVYVQSGFFFFFGAQACSSTVLAYCTRMTVVVCRSWDLSVQVSIFDGFLLLACWRHDRTSHPPLQLVSLLTFLTWEIPESDIWLTRARTVTGCTNLELPCK